jgi:hypothetical protein
VDASQICIGAEYAAGPDSKHNPFGTRARVRVTATGISVLVGRGPSAHLQHDGVRVRVIEPALEGPLTCTLREYEIPAGDVAMPWSRWCGERAKPLLRSPSARCAR